MSTSTGDPDTTAWATLPIGDRRAIGQALKGLMRRRWLWFSLLLIVLAVEAVCGFAIPVGLGRAVDAVSETSGAESLTPTIVIVAGGLVGAALFSVLGVLVSAKLFEPMAAELREDVVRQALAIDQVTLERAGSGDLLSRVGEDVAAVTQTLTGLVPRGLGAAVTLVAIMAGIITVDPRLAVPLALTIPLYVHAIRFYLREAPPILGEARRMSGHRSQEVIGAFRGSDTVKAFNLSDKAMTRVEASTWAVVKYGLLMRITSNRFFTRLTVAELAGTLSILLAGILLIQFQHLAIGAVVTAVLLYLRVLEPISTILMLSEPIQVGAISMSRIVGVGQVGGRGPVARIAATKNEPGPGHLVARNLTFGFEPGTPVLSGVDLDIPSGTTLAMVGASGAGKSTIAGLLAGIHEGWDGTIELDDRPLAERLSRGRCQGVEATWGSPASSRANASVGVR